MRKGHKPGCARRETSLITTLNVGSVQLTVIVGSEHTQELGHLAACVRNWRMACFMQLLEPFPEEHACPVSRVPV